MCKEYIYRCLVWVNTSHFVSSLKAKTTHGFYSCIVISVYPLDIPSIRKGTEYRSKKIDKLTF